uniref:NADH-ubiquinone oxidoreductase chain 6 n=1 Tax=Stilicoderus aquilinus TaxID=2994888 RepID=A0A9E8JXE1_9COLE|nr:NADH dehydrogenase subunit 6 [Stilicoderus aquilinus]UZN43814.1 NADH dehydrogenase subunit 6 [Stilicoderus aquilinus]
MSFMLMMLILLSIIFILMNHPLSMGMILLSQTILTALITGLLSINFWFSYIMFLIMIGGMLILFIYMTSIASNELFMFSKKIFIFSLFMITMMILLNWFIINFNYFNMNLMNLFYNNSMNLSLTKLFNYPSNYIMFLMIIYLLITLIAVVKIVNINSGPLRQNY